MTTSSGEQGMSFLDLELNTAPKGGSCSISPLTGVSTQTLFTVSCADWNDVDGVLTYQFFSKTSSHSVALDSPVIVVVTSHH